MANWDTLLGYVRNNYKIADEIKDDGGRVVGIKLLFDLGDLRSQVVYVWQQALEGGREPWFEVSSPLASADDVPLVQVLEEVGGLVCGGLAKVGDFLVLKHSAPLATLDIAEFERPLRLVTHSADRLEQKFGNGRDDF